VRKGAKKARRSSRARKNERGKASRENFFFSGVKVLRIYDDKM
jgi:hypothetical protein